MQKNIMAGKNKVIFIHQPKTGGESIKSLLPPSRIPAHRNLREIKEHFKKEGKAWRPQHLEMFSVVRNPWERIVSTYFHRKKMMYCGHLDGISFEQYVDYIYRYFTQKLGHPRGSYWYYDGPHRVCDYRMIEKCDYWFKDKDAVSVLHFEELSSEWDSFKERIGISEALPHLNKNQRVKYDSYRGFYNERTRAIIKELYEEEIDKFGYEF